MSFFSRTVNEFVFYTSFPSWSFCASRSQICRPIRFMNTDSHTGWSDKNVDLALERWIFWYSREICREVSVIGIFTPLKLCLATAIHNFKWKSIIVRYHGNCMSNPQLAENTYFRIVGGWETESLQLEFSLIWSCVSLPRSTTSSEWKLTMRYHCKSNQQLTENKQKSDGQGVRDPVWQGYFVPIPDSTGRWPSCWREPTGSRNGGRHRVLHAIPRVHHPRQGRELHVSVGLHSVWHRLV